MFRSALPRGERLGGAGSALIFMCFDPRSRAGSDARRWRFAGIRLFRSALPRGERPLPSNTAKLKN